MKKVSMFTRFAQTVARMSGSPPVFAIAVLVVIVWGVSGPLFHFSDTWQLVINTGTTIVTFLMVFLIQNTQNRDGMAVQAKLDELIHAIGPANNAMLNLEELDEKILARLHTYYCKMAELGRDNLEDLLDKYERGEVPDVLRARGEPQAGESQDGG